MGFLRLVASFTVVFSPPSPPHLPSPPLFFPLFKISLCWQWGEALLQIKSHLRQQRALLERLSSPFISSLSSRNGIWVTGKAGYRTRKTLLRQHAWVMVFHRHFAEFFLCSWLLVRGKCTCSTGWENVCFECGWRHWCWPGSASKFHKCSNHSRFQIPNQGIGPIGAQLAVGTSWIISVVANDIINSPGIPCTL